MITNRLSELAGRKRMRISEISRLSGIPYSVVQRLYNDQVRTIDFENLNKLCIVLECTPNEILKFELDQFFVMPINEEKIYKKLDRQCLNSFDKYLDIVSELPARERKQIEKQLY